MVSSYNRQQKLDSCFGGEIVRNCGVCQSHPRNGGTCCFGAKFDNEDLECVNCIHTDDCYDLCDSRSRRVPVSGKLPIRRTTGSTNKPIGAFPEVEMAERPITDDESILSRMAKEGIWGAGTGFFYSLYRYMSNHYWP